MLTLFVAPPRRLRLWCSTLIQHTDEPDEMDVSAREISVGELPDEVLMYLLNSRYCEVDRLSGIACDLFGNVRPGWRRVQAICDWVHNRISFDYQQARPTKTALDVYIESGRRVPGLSALAIAFCRALNMPWRATRPAISEILAYTLRLPMDFSAWFEAYLDGRWWTFDARNNQPRLGRILMATGRDASDVAMTTSFGQADLYSFFVVSEVEKVATSG